MVEICCLFQLLGCAILGCGLWIRFDPQFEKYVNSSATFGELYIGSYILLGVGACVMVVGFLGCCGAIRESQLLLATVSTTTISSYRGTVFDWCTTIVNA